MLKLGLIASPADQGQGVYWHATPGKVSRQRMPFRGSTEGQPSQPPPILVPHSSTSQHSNPPDLTSFISRAILLRPIIIAFAYADETLKAMASQLCSSSCLIVSDLDLCRQLPRTLDLYGNQPAHMKACTMCTTDLRTRKMREIRGVLPPR